MPIPKQGKALLIVLCLLVSPLCRSSHGEIVHETGSLPEFFHGKEPRCAYDNWVSHLSEGIARPGFNDYGPPELDHQTNGFGRYQPIDSLQNPQKILDDWYSIFTNILVGKIDIADTVLHASVFAVKYEIVELEDGAKRYIIVREKLNLEYFDDNETDTIATDDVRGSFDLGWGLYIFDNAAETPNVIFEVPHPCDDFIAPPISMDAFLLIGARAFFINGAGREVLWTGDSIYDNSKTLSDPSRLAVKSALQQAHRAVVDSIKNELVLQVHSYDTRARVYKPVLLSTYPDTLPDPPVMDRNKLLDIFSLTPTWTLLANSIGGFRHDSCRVDSFYACDNSGATYYTRFDSIEISTDVPMALARWPGPQVNYSMAKHDSVHGNANWLHIEHDELPNLINIPAKTFYKADGQVPTYQHYANAVAFYRPLYTAIRAYFRFTPLRIVPDAFATIQEAVKYAYDGDTILVKPGRYDGSVKLPNKNLTLGSLFLTTHDRAYIDSTILDGNLAQVVTFGTSNKVTQLLSGFTITNGSSENGGGLYINGSSPVISHCVIVSNSARTAGAGVYCSGGKPTFINCTFSHNFANQTGGGIYAIDGSVVMLSNCLMWLDAPQELYFGKGETPCSLSVQYSDIGGGEINLVVNNGDIVDWSASVIDADPGFLDPGHGNYHPVIASPVVDTGDPTSPLDDDSSRADMGALEAIVVEIAPDFGILPSTYSLEPAYPNPFNPTTTIRFGLPADGEVLIALYDISGRLVQQLTAGYHKAGTYTLTLNAHILPTGTYFLRMTADSFVSTQKLLLLK